MSSYYELIAYVIGGMILISAIVVSIEHASGSSGKTSQEAAAAQAPMSPILLIARHSVAVFIFSTAASFFLYPNDLLVGVIAINAFIFISSFVICGLAMLFFTNREKGRNHKSFIYSIWVMFALALIGSIQR